MAQPETDRLMGAVQKWAMPSRVQQKRERQTAEDAQWRAVCAAVTKRDASHCRVCGRRCDPFATAMLARGEHHHLTYRSAGGEDTTSNVVLLCLQCHADEHAGRIRVEGNGDTGIEVWRRQEDGTWYLSARETAVNVRERD